MVSIRSWLCLVLLAACLTLPIACGTRQAVVERDHLAQQAELTRLYEVIRENRGDADIPRGQELFAARCGNCHQLSGVGEGEVGGDLTLHRRDANRLPYLLQVIGFPDPAVHPYHTMFQVRTDDQRIISGAVADQDEQRVTVVNVAGEQIEIPRDNLRRQRPVYTTLIPDHLLAALTDQQIVELFAFLLDD